jgi:hypothetical protein
MSDYKFVLPSEGLVGVAFFLPEFEELKHLVNGNITCFTGSKDCRRSRHGILFPSDRCRNALDSIGTMPEILESFQLPVGQAVFVSTTEIEKASLAWICLRDDSSKAGPETLRTIQ